MTLLNFLEHKNDFGVVIGEIGFVGDNDIRLEMLESVFITKRHGSAQPLLGTLNGND